MADDTGKLPAPIEQQPLLTAQPGESSVSLRSVAQADASPTDSAPPLSAAASPPAPPQRLLQNDSFPATPPKSYNNAYSAPPPPSPSDLIRPNSAIPSFMRVLAFVLFVTGSATAAVAFFYRTVLYPRLVLAMEAKTKLYAGHLTSYSTLLDSLRSLKLAKGFSLIAPPTAPTPEFTTAMTEGEGEKGKAGAAETSSAAKDPTAEKKPFKDEDGTAAVDGKENEGEEDTNPKGPPPPQIFSSLVASLHDLSTAPEPPPKPLFFDPTATPQATDSLPRALTALTDYLATESYGSFNYSYSAGLGGSMPKSSTSTGAVTEAVNSLKAEIRQVKGTLLNRRNFAQLAPRGVSPAATPAAA